MDFSEHLALSLPVGAGLALATGQPEVGAAFVLGGVFIDFDHLPDYWREKGFTLSLAKLNAHFGGRDPRRLMLALHGWEWCALAWSLWAGLGLPLWFAGLAAGWTSHLLLDHRYNLLQPWAYWFFERYKRGFKAAPLYR